MKSKLLSIFIIVLGLCIFMFSLTACNRGNKNIQQPGPNNMIQQGRNLLGENLQGTNPGNPNTGISKGSGTGQGDRGFGATPGPNQGTTLSATPGISKLTQYLPQQLVLDRQKADNIRNQLNNSMREIGQTNVIVNGNNALIGYKANKAIKDANATQNMVINKVKQLDKSITNVIVTNKDQEINKLNQLSMDITNNKPIQELNTRFQQLLQGIKNATI